MRPTRSKRWGRTYNYYSCARDLDRGESICPVKSVSAGDIEKLVCDQVFQVVMSPEVISGVSRLTGLDPKNIREMFEHEFWNELTPTEKQRLMQILVEHVTVNPDDVTVELRTQNMKSVQEACNDRIYS